MPGAVEKRAVNIVSLIGTLEQFRLTSLLQRLESYAKTGLLIVRQGTQWVELYFRDGRLMCIGPVRTNATLGDRLLYDGLISKQALQEVLQMIGPAEPSETRIALALIDLGYIGHEQLRAWAMEKAAEVLQILLLWTSGEVHFEDEVAPPADRLLVAIMLSSLLDSVRIQNSRPNAPAASAPPTSRPPEPPKSSYLPKSGPLQPQMTRASELPNAPTLMGASQFGMEPSSYSQTGSLRSTPPPAASQDVSGAQGGAASSSAALSPFAAADAYPSVLGDAVDTSARESSGFLSLFGGGDEEGAPSSGNVRRQPEPIQGPFQPKRIDTSFMRPEMLLLPLDFSSLLEQNPSVQMTPDQWTIFTHVDGHTSLQAVCMNLGINPARVCQIAGELIAEGLIQVGLPEELPMDELSPISRAIAASGLSGGYITASPGAGTASARPPMVSDGGMKQGFETQSQWGNGGNGASFIPGKGWIASPQPLQPLQSSGPLGSHNPPYVPTGSNH